MGRVFANSLGDLSSIPGCVIPKTLKMVLDTSLLNTQQYKVRIKGKVEHPPLQPGVVAIEKGAFWSPSTTVANFTLQREWNWKWCVLPKHKNCLLLYSPSISVMKQTSSFYTMSYCPFSDLFPNIKFLPLLEMRKTEMINPSFHKLPNRNGKYLADFSLKKKASMPKH